MVVDMWYMGAAMTMVVYGSGYDDDAVMIYGSGDVTTCEQKLETLKD